MYVRVHALPGAKRERVTRDDESTFTIAVREPAERNLANRRIAAVLARELSVRENDVRLITGHRSSAKLYSIGERRLQD